MRVLIPYTARHIDTIEAAPDFAEWVDVSANGDRYWEILAERWTGSDLMVLEHDVVCRPDILDTFDTCPEPWCVFPYDNHSAEDAEAWANMLGCTRFRKELIAAVPHAVESIRVQHRHWLNMCDGVGNNLRAAGYTHHWHTPAVHHHQGALAHLAERIGA